MKCFGAVTMYAVLVASAVAQSPRPVGIEAKVAAKSGAWETLKVAKSAPTPNDARGFGTALPIGNGRSGREDLWGHRGGDDPAERYDAVVWRGAGAL